MSFAPGWVIMDLDRMTFCADGGAYYNACDVFISEAILLRMRVTSTDRHVNGEAFDVDDGSQKCFLSPRILPPRPEYEYSDVRKTSVKNAFLSDTTKLPKRKIIIKSLMNCIIATDSKLIIRYSSLIHFKGLRFG